MHDRKLLQELSVFFCKRNIPCFDKLELASSCQFTVVKHAEGLRLGRITSPICAVIRLALDNFYNCMKIFKPINCYAF